MPSYVYVVYAPDSDLAKVPIARYKTYNLSEEDETRMPAEHKRRHFESRMKEFDSVHKLLSIGFVVEGKSYAFFHGDYESQKDMYQAVWTTMNPLLVLEALNLYHWGQAPELGRFMFMSKMLHAKVSPQYLKAPEDPPYILPILDLASTYRGPAVFATRPTPPLAYVLETFINERWSVMLPSMQDYRRTPDAASADDPNSPLHAATYLPVALATLHQRLGL